MSPGRGSESCFRSEPGNETGEEMASSVTAIQRSILSGELLPSGLTGTRGLPNRAAELQMAEHDRQMEFQVAEHRGTGFWRILRTEV